MASETLTASLITSGPIPSPAKRAMLNFIVFYFFKFLRF
jgi:hypothetical protein